MTPSLELPHGFFRAGLVPGASVSLGFSRRNRAKRVQPVRFRLTTFQRPQDRQQDKPSAATMAEQLLKRLKADKQPPADAWDSAIREGEYTSRVIAIVTTWLHRQKKFDLAVEGLLSAIRNGLAEPWMYDVLAVEMTLAKRPQKQIDRVLVSRIDFATGDDAQMLVAASNLAGFDAFDEALGICREMAKRNPHQPELWSTARRVADLSGNLKHRVWARTETLRHVWAPDFEVLHQKMKLELEDLVTAAEKSSDLNAASMVREALRDAVRRDLRIRIDWVGDGDLDLSIVEPNGVVCRRKQSVTRNGGMLVKQDSIVSPNEKKRTEEYVCVDALRGKYTVRVEHIDGRVLLGRVQVKVTRNEGTPAQKTETFVLRNVLETPGELSLTL